MVKNNGFTLLELMIVIAIVGILASVAIPEYVKYTKRAKYTEVTMATTLYKTAAVLAYESGIPKSDLTAGSVGIPPAINASNPAVGEHVESVTMTGGVIIATSNKDTIEAAPGVGAVYQLEAIETGNGGLRWLMDQDASTCLDAGYCAPTEFIPAGT